MHRSKSKCVQYFLRLYVVNAVRMYWYTHSHQPERKLSSLDIVENRRFRSIREKNGLTTTCAVQCSKENNHSNDYRSPNKTVFGDNCGTNTNKNYCSFIKSSEKEMPQQTIIQALLFVFLSHAKRKKINFTYTIYAKHCMLSLLLSFSPWLHTPACNIYMLYVVYSHPSLYHSFKQICHCKVCQHTIPIELFCG